MEIVDYARQTKQMGDLLQCYGVSLKDDFTDDELNDLRMQLEKVFKDDSTVTLNLKKVLLQIKGADEAGYLYQYL